MKQHILNLGLKIPKFNSHSIAVGEMAGNCSSGDQSQSEKKAANPEAANGTKVEANKQKNLKRTAKLEEVYLIDATKEGNVSRFINVSNISKQSF